MRNRPFDPIRVRVRNRPVDRIRIRARNSPFDPIRVRVRNRSVDPIRVRVRNRVRNRPVDPIRVRNRHVDPNAYQRTIVFTPRLYLRSDIPKARTIVTLAMTAALAMAILAICAR